MNSIEVCLSPALFGFRKTHGNYIVVIVDVLRATTAFCAAFDSGIEMVIPVSGLDELAGYKNKGYLTAAERDGKKSEFADFGNSPTVFLQNNLTGSKLAYSTTNGTKAIEVAKVVDNIATASFANLNAIGNWLINQHKNVLILCSGWKNTFSLEDTLCAGAIVEILENSGQFALSCDASITALSGWQSAKNELVSYVGEASHYQRLLAMGLHDDLKYCFMLNTSKAIPVWNGVGFKDLSGKKK
jgi:2-phosphosulfolactate phosphatase